ncbi:MAG: xanthine dehydrogenase family protein molybdopterin-binding subunit [Deltaproteobacteria bacterium]|nr:xanthine dehydrogenase family protein molybdopterin-binding subunit [Deltaproteobacteria bacterium]
MADGRKQEFAVVGKSVPRVDGPPKVTGTPIYTVDMERPGMLHAAILRSTVPHGRIRRVDKSRAEQAEGVVLVVTGEDLKTMPGIDPYFGPAFRDQAILAIDKVRYIGDPVAAVVATRRELAYEALDLIDVEYEELPPVLDPVEAARPGSPLVHEQLRPAKAFADLAEIEPGKATNVCYHFKLRRGDVEQGFAQSAHVFEDWYYSPPAQHMMMEPHAALAWVDSDGVLTVITGSQSPSYVKGSLGAIFGLPQNKVRVMVPLVGGAYGGKLYDKLEPLASLLTFMARRPVKIQLTREEVFITITKHGVVSHVRTGVSQDGKILARKVEVYWDTGAYADIAPRVVHKSGYTSAGAYRVPNIWIDSYCVYTNKPPAGAFRGFGVPQVVWALESQMDMIAEKLGRDPLQFRLENVLLEGDLFATGTPVHSAGLKESLEAVAREIKWEPGVRKAVKPGTKSGVARAKGVACGIKAVITPSISGAIVVMNNDASVNVLTSTVEMGQGSDTALSQIAAEELGVRLQDVRVMHPDTAVTPYDTITAGSRSTYHMGNAIRLAAQEVKKQLFETASDRLEVDPDQLVASDGRIFVAEAPTRGLPIPEVFQARFGARGATLQGQAVFKTYAAPMDHETGQSEKVTEYWFPGATAAEVEVDLETGKVRVVKLVEACDVGRAINPHHCEQQIIGSALISLGQTLFEQMILENGELLNPTLLDYKVLTLKDVPESAVPIVIEVPHKDGPFGAKGVGETGTLSVSAAIGNAVYRATGVRVKELPITPEKVLRGLRAGQ